MLAVKNFFDDWMLNANCVEAAMATSLIVEHGFTNIQFVALAADAMEAGDVDFSNLLSSIQTDEARHAQLGFPTLEVLMKHDPKRAQYIFDVSFWRSFRLFQTLTGTSMDYYTPVAKRKMSFKEFMLEWVVHHHERTMKDYGLRQALVLGHLPAVPGPWPPRDAHRHLVLAADAVLEAQRRRLEGRARDGSTASTRAGKTAGACCGTRSSPTSTAATWPKTYPETLPALCNITQLPLGSAWDRHHLKMHTSEYKGRLYNFDSEVSKWIFDSEPERYAGHTNVVDRFLLGQIQPMNLAGGLQWMGITPEVMGDDAYAYRWAAEYAQAERKAA